MQYEIQEIKHIRKKLGITQFELAKKANVSQSLIAKIESNKIDPSYTHAKKIFETLTALSNKEELKAEEIMNKKILFGNSSDNIQETIKTMKKHGISQLPVLEHNHCVGLVSESIILDALLNKKGTKLGEIMADAPPTISKDAGIEIISNLLRFYPVVIVVENGKYIGLITKSDLLEKISKKN